MSNRLTRSSDEKIFGVAAGLAAHFNFDTTVMRLMWVIAALVIGPEIAVLYLVAALVLPKGDAQPNEQAEPEVIYEKDPTAFA